MSAAPDVIVVGGGVIGLATAWALCKRGARVVVLERDAIGRGASWAGGGILSPLPPGHCPESLRPLLDDSLQRYPAWCAELAECSGIDPEYWVCGGRYIGASGEMALPDLAQVRNPRLLKALAVALRRRGVELHEGHEVSGWQVSGGKLRGVKTRHAVWPCARAVLAAGAWSAALGATGIRPIKGQMLLFKLQPGDLNQIVIDDEAYVIPRRDGHVLVGSTLEDVGFDVTATDEARDWLMRKATLLSSVLAEAKPVQQWSGLRPNSEQGLPLLRESQTVAGLHHATGHSRIGITLAPGSAERLADAVTAVSCASTPSA